MNVAKLLKEYGKPGDEFYSRCFGKVQFVKVDSTDLIEVEEYNKDSIEPTRYFYKNGRYSHFGEVDLFPSAIQHDWNQWAKEKEIERRSIQFTTVDRVLYKGELYSIIEAHPETGHYRLRSLFAEGSVYQDIDIEDMTKIDHFDAKLLKPFDQVLVRDSEQSSWCISHFSHMPGSCRPYVCENFQEYQFCIPYNDETANLVGTTNTPHKFYC